MNSNREFSPAFRALIAQFLGCAAGLFIWWLSSETLDMPTFAPLFAVAMGAAVAGKFLLDLPNWWIPLNAGFVPGIFGAMMLNLPGWIYLLAFVLTLAVFWNARTERVPLYLTNSATWRKMLELLPEKSGGRFVDLGSGLSGTLRFLARQRPDMAFVGVESAPIPLLISKTRQWFDPLPNLTVSHGDIWQVDLSGFDVAYSFLSPSPMTRLYEKASREMRPGSQLVSNSFEVDDHPPHDVCTVTDSRETRLLIWRF